MLDRLHIDRKLIVAFDGGLLDFYRIMVESRGAAIRAWGRHGFDGCLMVCPACRVAKEHVTLVSKKLSGEENFALAA